MDEMKTEIVKGMKMMVRLIRSEIKKIKNVDFGEIKYMNYSSVNADARIENTDVVGIYGQNGSGKTAMIEALDILKSIIMGTEISYKEYAGIMPKNDTSVLINDFFVDYGEEKYKVCYEAHIRANEETEKIEIFQEKLIYWDRGASWKNEKDIEFENPYYNADDIMLNRNVSIKTRRSKCFEGIDFLFSMQNLSIFCAQRHISVFFNKLVQKSLYEMKDVTEASVLFRIIHALNWFGNAGMHIIKVNQLGAINDNIMIPLNMRCENENSTIQGCLPIFTNGQGEIPEKIYNLFPAVIRAINIVIKSIIPNIQIEIEEKNIVEKEDGKRYVQVEVYSRRGDKKFLIKYESEGVKRIVSLLNYLISVYNNESVCLAVDELDSGVFEYLLGELLGVLYKEMKGQLIFTSHNLRILEKLGNKNIVCSTTNPKNRYIRLKGVEKNHNRRDFYIRALTIGGQNEELYDEDDLIAMGYAFRKAGKANEDSIEIPFSNEFEKKLAGGGDK